jgi:hypothetical protein
VSIDDFVYKKYIVRDNVPEDLIKPIDKLIGDVCYDYGLTLNIISTNYVFPRIIGCDKENILIWDQTYWEIFRQFLIYLTDLSAIKEKSVIYNDDFAQPLILIPLTYYLAMIVKDKKIAFNFANYYKFRMQRRQVFLVNTSLNAISRYIEIAKIYVSVHEQIHFMYKNNKIQKLSDLKSIEDMLDIVYRLFESYDEAYCKEKYLKSKSELLEIVNFVRNNDDLKEELLCDTYSLNNCIESYRNALKKEYSEKKIFTRCLEAIQIVNYYNSILILLKTFWQECNCNIDEISIQHKAISSRMYLFDVISAIQIVKQDLQDYQDKEFCNYSSFEDNYMLEEIIHTYFFDEKAVKYWKNISLSNDYEKITDKDIYELLQWR